jgi:hypothetical protein
MMRHEPIYLRLCTDEPIVVSEGWWRRFLLSQAKALGDTKKRLTRTSTMDVQSQLRGTGTDEVELIRENGNGGRPTVQV